MKFCFSNIFSRRNHFYTFNLKIPVFRISYHNNIRKTLLFNCFIDFDASGNARLAYEVMLKKIDELVRAMSIKVYKPDQELLTISDVTEVRDRLA